MPVPAHAVLLGSAPAAAAGGLPFALMFNILYYAGNIALADGAAVATWEDDAGSADATQSTAGKKPTYRATGGANSKPCVEFDGGDRLTATISALSQGFSTVVIGQQSSTDNTKGTFFRTSTNVLVDSEGAGAAKRLRMYAGSATSSATDAAGETWHLHTNLFNGAGSVYNLDGTTNFGLNSGSLATGTGLDLGADSTEVRFLTGKMSLIGFYAGNVLDDSNWSDFKTWAGTFYGLTIA